jgi:YggT family protein
VTLWTSFVLYVLSAINGLLTLYFWVVIVAALMTWIEPNPDNPIVRFLYSVTEPLFDWIREHIPVMFGGIDFSPVVVLFAIGLVQQVLLPAVERSLVFGYAGTAS